MHPFHRRTLLVCAVLAVLAALIAGAWYVGYSAGTQSALQGGFHCQKIHVALEVSALQNLHEGKLEAVSDSLETGVFYGVSLLAPPERVALMDEQTRKSVAETLGTVKAYRRETPWPTRYDKAFVQQTQTALEQFPEPASQTSCPSR